MSEQLLIKNMVCNRCIEAVEEEFKRLSIPVKSIQLGQVQVTENLSKEDVSRLDSALKTRGFELLEDKTSKTIEKVKNLLIDVIHYRDAPLKVNFSTFLEDEINLDYGYVSRIFSSVTGLTIEQFIILQKIEKVKELLIYDQLTLSEIAYKLGYSSVQHLSNQFKKNTGMTPTSFKKSTNGLRRPIDKVDP